MRLRLTALLITALLAVPLAGATGTVGFRAGDTFLYQYNIITFSGTDQVGNPPHTVNLTTTIPFKQRIAVLQVNPGLAIGTVAYNITVIEANGTIPDNPASRRNTTAIFEPFKNDTYRAQLGFYPFTYTSIPVGTRFLQTIVKITDPASGQVVSVLLHINVTVSRSPGQINVKFAIKPGVTRWFFGNMNYSDVTGVLQNGTVSTFFLTNPVYYTYELLESGHTDLTDYSYLVNYIPHVAAAAVAVAAGYSIATRKSRAERKAQRMKERLGKHGHILKAVYWQ